MTNEQTALSRRAVACRGWQWMPGMRNINGRRLAVVFGLSRTASVLCDLRDDANSDTEELQGELPDLADPATLGCLLALVREAYRDASKLWDGHVEVHRDHRILFFVVSFRHDASGALVEDTLATGGTEAEALVAALESAP